MLQRRRQAIGALLSMIAFCAIVEVPYQIEEASFTKKAKLLTGYVADYQAEHGRFPSEETIRAEHPQLSRDMAFRYDHGADGEMGHCTISRPRWIHSNHSLWYSSKTGELGCWE